MIARKLNGANPASLGRTEVRNVWPNRPCQQTSVARRKRFWRSNCRAVRGRIDSADKQRHERNVNIESITRFPFRRSRQTPSTTPQVNNKVVLPGSGTA